MLVKAVFLNRVVTVGLTEKETSEARPEADEGVSNTGTLGECSRKKEQPGQRP